MVTRLEMRETTHRALVDAAVKLFGRAGYADTSVEQIVAEIGLTKGAFYHYFSGKEELLLYIQHLSLDEAIKRGSDILEEDTTPAEKMSKLIRVQLDILFYYGRALQGMLASQRIGSSADWNDIRAKRREIEDFFVRVIDNGRSLGDFTVSGDPRLAAYGILGMCYWSYVWYRPSGSWSVDTVSGQFTELALSGLLGRGESTS